MVRINTLALLAEYGVALFAIANAHPALPDSHPTRITDIHPTDLVEIHPSEIIARPTNPQSFPATVTIHPTATINPRPLDVNVHLPIGHDKQLGGRDTEPADIILPPFPLTEYFANSNATAIRTQVQNAVRIGYRIISINNHDDSVPRYAVVLRLERHVAQRFAFGLSYTELEEWLRVNQRDGFTPVLIAATDARERAVYSVVLDQNSAAAVTLTCRLSYISLRLRDDEMRARGTSPMVDLVHYGDIETTYCAIWSSHPNPRTEYLVPETPRTLTQFRDRAATLLAQGYHPTRTTIKEDERYVSLFTKSSIEPSEWTTPLTLPELRRNVLDQRRVNGRELVQLAAYAGSVDETARFFALFAKREIPQ